MPSSFFVEADPRGTVELYVPPVDIGAAVGLHVDVVVPQSTWMHQAQMHFYCMYSMVVHQGFFRCWWHCISFEWGLERLYLGPYYW